MNCKIFNQKSKKQEEEQLALRHKSKYLREKTEEELPTTVQITIYDSEDPPFNWIFLFRPCIKDF